MIHLAAVNSIYPPLPSPAIAAGERELASLASFENIENAPPRIDGV